VLVKKCLDNAFIHHHHNKNTSPFKALFICIGIGTPVAFVPNEEDDMSDANSETGGRNAKQNSSQRKQSQVTFLTISPPLLHTIRRGTGTHQLLEAEAMEKRDRRIWPLSLLGLFRLFCVFRFIPALIFVFPVLLFPFICL
jgi:hypothetical protein